MKAIPLSRLDYCQFLVVSQVNYSLTYLAEHAQKYSHDTINRFLKYENYSPKLLWEHVKQEIITSPNGLLIFDDTVFDKSNTTAIEVARNQWSGAAGRVIRGIGLVSCIYYNPDIQKCWVIDYRVFSPEQDGKTKVDHILEMFRLAVLSKKIEFRNVFMDTWYATKEIMLEIDNLDKIFYCTIKSNRKFSKVDQIYKHTLLNQYEFKKEEYKHGLEVHLHGFPSGRHVKLFCIFVSSDKVDYVVTNDISQDNAEVVQKEFNQRWVIELFHREIKQTTGIAKCQCRKQRIQRNHIACCLLVWTFMKKEAYKLGKTIYQIKKGLLDNYMKQQLKSPNIKYIEAGIA